MNRKLALIPTTVLAAVLAFAGVSSAHQTVGGVDCGGPNGTPRGGTSSASYPAGTKLTDYVDGVARPVITFAGDLDHIVDLGSPTVAHTFRAVVVSPDTVGNFDTTYHAPACTAPPTTGGTSSTSTTPTTVAATTPNTGNGSTSSSSSAPPATTAGSSTTPGTTSPPANPAPTHTTGSTNAPAPTTTGTPATGTGTAQPTTGPAPAGNASSPTTTPPAPTTAVVAVAEPSARPAAPGGLPVTCFRADNCADTPALPLGVDPTSLVVALFLTSAAAIVIARRWAVGAGQDGAQ